MFLEAVSEKLLDVMFQITLGQTLRAIVVLRSLIIEWVVVKGIKEDLHIDDRKPDAIWTTSRYKVFQKVCMSKLLITLIYLYKFMEAMQNNLTIIFLSYACQYEVNLILEIEDGIQTV